MLNDYAEMAPTRTVEMKRLIAALLATSLFASIAHAEKVAYACQFTASGGLQWERGQWVLSKFIQQDKFILMMVGTGESREISTESARKLMVSGTRYPTCLPITATATGNNVMCYDSVGEVLMFDPEGGTGALSYLYGGVRPPRSDGYRDSMAVSAFTCSKF